MTNPYRRWTRLSAYAALVVLLLSLALTPMGRTVALWSLVLGGSLAFSLLLMALICWLYAKKADKHLAAFRSGSHLAHWTYKPEEWHAFAEEEWARTQKRARWAPLWALLLGAVIGLVLVPALGVTGLMVAVLLGVAAGWGIGRLVLSTGRQKYERARHGAAETYIGTEAALINGSYFHWSGAGVSLSGLELAPGNPSVLEFTVRAGHGTKSSYHTHRVPVPAGRLGEAEKILATLRA